MNRPRLQLVEGGKLEPANGAPPQRDAEPLTTWALFELPGKFVARMFEVHSGGEIVPTQSYRVFATIAAARHAMDGSGCWIPRHSSDPENLVGSWI